MASTGRSGGPFPNYIAGERAAQDLSQAELALKSGLDRPWLSRIESGQVLCGPAQLDSVAEALGVSAGRLYDRDWLEVIGMARREEQQAHARDVADGGAGATTSEDAA